MGMETAFLIDQVLRSGKGLLALYDQNGFGFYLGRVTGMNFCTDPFLLYSGYISILTHCPVRAI